MEQSEPVKLHIAEKFPESVSIPEDDRRIDFLCLGYGSTLNVVELKRPGSTIGRKELEQLERYVDHIRTLQGTDRTVAYTTIVGYVIGGQESRTRDYQQKAQRLERDSMYVRTYEQLEHRARKVHQRFIGILERKAKRTKDSRIVEGLNRLKKEVQVIKR